MDFSRLTDPQAYKDALAGLLRRGTEVGEYIEQAPTKVGQSILDAGQRQSALMNKAFDPTGNTLIRDPEAANQAAMNLFEGPMSFAPAGITAFHGTPHLFDKFDMKKVGTGEGVQAYGHGMYFTESPNVAKEYQKALSGYVNNSKGTLNRAGGDFDMAIQKTQDSIKHYKTHPFNEESKAQASRMLALNERKLQELMAMKAGIPEPTGNLYKVDIPDEYIPKMLDWDKPLSQQSESVQNWLKDPYNAYKAKLIAKDVGGNEPTGSLIYNRLQELMSEGKKSDVFANQANLGSLNASRELADYGITGIRYLDEGSRSTGKGTSNYVVFDPSDVKILERNNQPISRKELLQEQIDKIAQ
jgi:hypothetical protein